MRFPPMLLVYMRILAFLGIRLIFRNLRVPLKAIWITVKIERMEKTRCDWANLHELLMTYHDQEWGIPVKDDAHLFEMLNLEGAQAGLSWLTVLKKRESYREAFDQFNPNIIVRYGDKKKRDLMQNDGIIRNRLKIEAVIQNADAFLNLIGTGETFSHFLWKFVKNKPLLRPSNDVGEQVSLAMSLELKRTGFKFVGATICYAFMQAVGMVNDHEPGCFCSRQIKPN